MNSMRYKRLSLPLKRNSHRNNISRTILVSVLAGVIVLFSYHSIHYVNLYGYNNNHGLLLSKEIFMTRPVLPIEQKIHFNSTFSEKGHRHDAKLLSKHRANNDAARRNSTNTPVHFLATHNTTHTQSPGITTVAYVISLIKCGDKQSNVGGLTDAALVLRHSIHVNSIRTQRGRYDYRMYAIVHEKAEHCSQPLKDAGFEIMVKSRPVEKWEVQSQHLREKMNKEWCCGHDEFIKLYTYQMTEYPIVVHMDIDFVLNKPLDDLFDVLLDPSNDEAKARIDRERPDEEWPQDVQAFLTRDWGQVVPGRTKPGYQAGFIAHRPDPSAFDELVHIIRHENYTGGFAINNGWGNMGYGGFVGAMAMQGLLAYFYDIKRPHKWVELNQCRHNHMGMDVRYRSQPNFMPGKYRKKVGKCRNNKEDCEDCMVTDIAKIFSIHYTQCRKPWNCIGEGKLSNNAKENIPEDSVHLDHCMELIQVWHAHRKDLEDELLSLTGDKAILEGQTGSYKKEYFHGHCTGNFGENYLEIGVSQDTLKRIPELYVAG